MSAELVEKTGPIRLLENRRHALLKWIDEGGQGIFQREEEIKKIRVEGMEMMAELDEIEAALNALNDAAKRSEEKVLDG